MTAHTPGPWTIVESKDPIVVSHWHIQIGNVSIPFFPYKRIYSEDLTQSGLVRDDEQMANARLIAAAPDLLAALKEIAANDPYCVSSAGIIARAAIKKAEGAA